MNSPPRDTRAIVERFNEAFQRHQPDLLTDLVADDCVLENTVPAPDGDRYVGREACLALWRAIASDLQSRFEVEEVRVLGDHALIFWRYWPGASISDSMRGVNVMRTAGGRIVEGRGYVKQLAREAGQ